MIMLMLMILLLIFPVIGIAQRIMSKIRIMSMNGYGMSCSR